MGRVKLNRFTLNLRVVRVWGGGGGGDGPLFLNGKKFLGFFEHLLFFFG